MTTSISAWTLIVTIIMVNVSTLRGQQPGSILKGGHLETGAQKVDCVCSIIWNDMYVDCSSLELDSVPECVPNDTRVLNLNNNQIQFVPTNSMRRFSKLNALHLKFNIISNLEEGSFNGLSAVTDLILARNHLKSNNSLADTVFAPLFNLRRLWLQGNCDSSFQKCSYADLAFSHAPNLQFLHIDGINGADLGDGFASLVNLSTLVMGGSDFDYGNCILRHIKQSTFQSLKHTPLSTLKLFDCDSYTIEPYSFQMLWNLQVLNISYQRHLCGQSLENITSGLNETNIRSLILTNNCKYAPFFPEIDQRITRNLYNSSLERLDLSGNNIFFVNPNFVTYLPRSVQYISFRENILGDGHFLEKLAALGNLRTFDISYQSDYTNVGLGEETGATGLYYGAVDQATPRSNSSVTGVNMYRTLTIIHLPPKIENINMGHLPVLKYPVPGYTFGTNELRYLDASSCLLSAFFGPWIGLDHLEFLNMSNNNFGLMHPKTFTYMFNLKTLLLQGNKMGNYITYNSKLFSANKRLELLNISDNGVKTLPREIFGDLENLRILVLSANFIRTIDFRLDGLTKLNMLDLSNNEITEISEANIDFLDEKAKRSSLIVNLDGNVLPCKCGDNRLLHWLITTSVNITGTISCNYINGTVIQLRPDITHEVIDQLFYECSAWLVLVCCGVGFVVLLLFAALVAVLYHKRWQLRYLYHLGSRNVNPYHPLEGEDVELNVDVHLSYEADKAVHGFVADYVYTYLTDNDNVVKIREQLDPHKPLNRTIADTIRSCRKMVVFLTPNCFRDYWNTYEFNMSVLEGIYTKRNMIVPVVVGDIGHIYLPREIKSIIRAKLESREVICIPWNIVHHPSHNETEIRAAVQLLEMHLRGS